MEETTGVPDEEDPAEAALALECLSRVDAKSCGQPAPEGSPGRCEWMAALRLPRCAAGCDALLPAAVCVAMRRAPESGCLCPCEQFWHATVDGVVLVPADPDGLGFCFDFPVGWRSCGEDQAACACCVDDCF